MVHIAQRHPFQTFKRFLNAEKFLAHLIDIWEMIPYFDAFEK